MKEKINMINRFKWSLNPKRYIYLAKDILNVYDIKRSSFYNFYSMFYNVWVLIYKLTSMVLVMVHT